MDEEGIEHQVLSISTHAPAGGATMQPNDNALALHEFLLTPLREGRRKPEDATSSQAINFYSRPCGRGDLATVAPGIGVRSFLLTPLREGRRTAKISELRSECNFYSRPCGRGDVMNELDINFYQLFLLTPLREGRRNAEHIVADLRLISTHAPAGGATYPDYGMADETFISTHAPAGGATQSWGADNG